MKKILLFLLIPGGAILLAIQFLIWRKKLPENFWSLSNADKWTFLKGLVIRAQKESPE